MSRVIITGAFANYGKLLKEKYMYGLPMISDVHGASEGIIGVNVSPDADCLDYAFLLRDNFFEFIPEENVGEENPKTFFIGEVGVPIDVPFHI